MIWTPRQVYFVLVVCSYLWNLSLPEFVKDKVRPQSPRSPTSSDEDSEEEQEEELSQGVAIGPAIRRLMSYESVLNADDDNIDAEAVAAADAPGTEASDVARQGTTASVSATGQTVPTNLRQRVSE